MPSNEVEIAAAIKKEKALTCNISRKRCEVRNRNDFSTTEISSTEDALDVLTHQ